MDPLIDFARSAEENALARSFASSIRENVLSSERKRAIFNSLRCAVAVVVEDLAQSFTLRFDYGRLTVHNGIVGVPDITVSGDRGAIEPLSEVSPLTVPGLPLGLFGSAEARRGLASAARTLGSGRLRVYGLWLRPRLVLRLLVLLGGSG